MSDQTNNTLLGDDNVIMVKSKYTCLLFDDDFDGYLADHALPIKTISEGPSDNHHFDKAGMTEEVKY